MKKLLAVILALAMLAAMSIGVSAYTINQDDAQIGADQIFGVTAVYFADAQVEKNGDVTVDIILESNPGVTDIAVTFALPADVSIKAVANGNMGTASLNGNVVTIAADSVFSADGCVAKVTFTATELGEKTVVLTATAKNGEDDIAINGSDCIIVVSEAAVSAVPGDVNGDGELNTTDLAVIKLFLADGERTESVVNPDVNGDGLENTSDLAQLKLLLSGE